MHIYSFPGFSSHIQKILKSSEKQESEKRIKMQQEVVEVLETSGKSKKCNPVEAGLYKFKAQKLGSGILYSGHIFPKKLPEKPPTVPIGFDFEIEESNSEKQRGYCRTNSLNLCKALRLSYLVRCCVCSR